MAVGDVVARQISGSIAEVVVGRLVEVGGERVHVEADDGPGRYVVTPDRVEGARVPHRVPASS